MINRVQAFNNKNTHKQNFGMAVCYADDATRVTMNKITKEWGARGRKLLKKTINRMAEEREKDKCVDIVFYNTDGDTVAVDVFTKGTGAQASMNRFGSDIRAKSRPGKIRNELNLLNKEAQRLDQEIQNENVLQSEDVFAEIKKIDYKLL